MTQNEHNFKIAELNVRLRFAESPYNNMSLLPSLEPFRAEHLEGQLFFQLYIDDTLRPIPKDERKRIRSFDTGNGDTIVAKLEDGGYKWQL